MPVGSDGFLLAAERLQGVAGAEQRAGVFGPDFERAAVGGEGVFGAPDRRQGGGEQKVRPGGGGLQAGGALEAVQGFSVAVLFVVERTQVQEGEGVVGRERQGAEQQCLRFAGFRPAGEDARQQAHRVDVVRGVAQNFAIEPLGIVAAAFPVVFGGERQLPALRIQRERSLERSVGTFPLAGHRQRPAQMEERHFRLRIQPGRVPQGMDGLPGAPGFDEQQAEVFVRLGEIRRQLDGAPELRFRLTELPYLEQDGAVQRPHADIVGMALQHIHAGRGGGVHAPGLDETHRPVECRPGRQRPYRLHSFDPPLRASDRARERSITSGGVHLLRNAARD